MTENPFLKKINPFLPKREVEKEDTVGGIAGSAVTGAVRGLTGLADLPADIVNLSLRGSNFIANEAIELVTGENPNTTAIQMPHSGFRMSLDANTGENQFFKKPETTAEQATSLTAEFGVAVAVTGPIGGGRAVAAKAITRAAKQTEKLKATTGISGLTPSIVRTAESVATRTGARHAGNVTAAELKVIPSLRDAAGRYMSKLDSAKKISKAAKAAKATEMAGRGPIGQTLGLLTEKAQFGIARSLDASSRVAVVPSFIARYGAEKFNRFGGSIITGPIDRAAMKVFGKLKAPGEVAAAAYESFGGAGYLGWDIAMSFITGMPLPTISVVISGKLTQTMLATAAKTIRNPDKVINAVLGSKYYDALIIAKNAGKDAFKASLMLLAIEPEFQDLVFGSDVAKAIREIPVENENPFLR